MLISAQLSCCLHQPGHHSEVFIMQPVHHRPEYRIESGNPLIGNLLPPQTEHLYASCSLAVAVAVKSVADPSRQQVRVVHVPSGEIMFQTAPAPLGC